VPGSREHDRSAARGSRSPSTATSPHAQETAGRRRCDVGRPRAKEASDDKGDHPSSGRTSLVRRNILDSQQFAYQHRWPTRMEWNMCNPTDPYRNDQSRRYGLRGADEAGFWPWLTAALTALGLLIGWTIGYNWGWGAHEKSAQSRTPTTTGSAPSQQRPAPTPAAPNP
jgi:hypothetical protein